MRYLLMQALQPFSVDRLEFLKTLMLSPRIGWPVWTAVCVGAVCMAIGIFLDLRLLVVGLMACVAVAPMLAAFIYFNHSLAPDMVPNLIPHTLERIPEGYLLRTWRAIEQDGETDEDARWEESGSFRLLDSMIVKRKSTYSYEILFFNASPMRILYVPRF